jgi:hypothetical protein
MEVLAVLVQLEKSKYLKPKFVAWIMVQTGLLGFEYITGEWVPLWIWYIRAT